MRTYVMLYLSFLALPTYGQGGGKLREQIADAAENAIGEAYQQWYDGLDMSDQRRIGSAISLCNKVKAAGSYVSSLKELVRNGQIPLPVGIKDSNNPKYQLVVSNLVRDNDSAATILLSCVIPLKSSILAFDGKLSITGNSGLCAPGRIEMMAPVSLGKNIRLEFKKGTYAEFDCEGIQKFHAEVDVLIDSTRLLFYDDNDSVLKSAPKISTQLEFSDIDDFTFSLEKKIRFGFKPPSEAFASSKGGLKDWIFTIERLDFDNSDVVTSASAKFPEGYFAGGSVSEKNLWKGVSVSGASLRLPKTFSKGDAGDSPYGKQTASSDTAMKSRDVSCDYFIVDDNGFSISAKASNIATEIDTAKRFAMNVDNAEFCMVKDDVKKVYFDGEFNWKTLGRFSRHDYSALYNDAESEFCISSDLGDSIVLDFICADLQLDKSTKLNFKVKDGKFLPSVTANGNVTIHAGAVESALNIPQLDFEGMHIGLEKPYFRPGTWQMEGSAAPSFGTMPIQLSNLGIFNEDFKFDADIQFCDMLTAGGSFDIVADYDELKLKRFSVNKFYVDYRSAVFSIYGNIAFDKNDAIFGNYFRGDVKLELAEILKINATALFGKVGGNKYFFADIYAENEGRTIFTIPPKFDVYGLGGGAYRKMSQTAEQLLVGKAPSGLCYKPDMNVGFGFTATMKFGVVSKAICDASTIFEAQFNDRWGLNYLQLKGDAIFLNNNKKFESLTGDINSVLNRSLDTSSAKLLKPGIAGQYPMTASSLFKYDNANKTFFAYMRTYLDMGIMYGKGQDKKLVDATALFGSSDWYMHVGTPDDRCGMVADLGILNLDINSYFMVGNGIPAMPMPPDKVTRLFSKQKISSYRQNRDLEAVSNGKGVAFGAGFETSVSVKPWPFYAELGVGAGGEFLLTNYGKDAHCEGRDGAVGIDGWYANAQFWAYLDAKLGISVKFMGKRRTFSIMDAAAGAILAGAGPNPFYFQGLVGCKYRVLGGLFKGTCSIDFEIGKPCKVAADSSLLDQSIIAGMTPEYGSDSVNVFVSPQLLLNIAANLEMPMEVDGEKNTYKVFVDDIKITNFATGEQVEGTWALDDEGLVMTFDPETALESLTKYKMEAKVSFKQKIAGSWVTAKDSDGTEYAETFTTEFTTGKRPDHILPEHIVCTYPVDRMYNFYPKETCEGYICLSENYSYLFDSVPEGYEQKVRLSTLDGKSQASTFSRKHSSEVEKEKYEVGFNLGDFKFDKQEIYKLEIINLPLRTSALNENINTGYTVSGGDSVRSIAAEGNFNQLEAKQIFALNFRASKYSTLAEKVDNIDLEGAALVDGTDNHMKNISKAFLSDDFFDMYEEQLRGQTNKLVHLEADLPNTSWYRKSIYKTMYDNYTESQIVRERPYNYPPSEAMTIFNAQSIKHNSLSDNEIASGIIQGIYPDGEIDYVVIFQCDEDIRTLQNALAVKYDKGESLTSDEQRILDYIKAESYTKGSYPYKISYRLPGKGKITSTINKSFKY